MTEPNTTRSKVGRHPAILLGSRGSRPLDAVHPVTRRGEAAGRNGRGRDRQQRVDQIVTHDTASPAAKQLTGGRSNVEARFLVDRTVVGDRVTSPIGPHREAVAVQRFLIAAERAGADARAGQLADQRNVDLLAVRFQIGHADDRHGRRRAHEGIEPGPPQEVRGYVFAELDEFVIWMVRSEGHLRHLPFVDGRHPPNKKPATRAGYRLGFQVDQPATSLNSSRSDLSSRLSDRRAELARLALFSVGGNSTRGRPFRI
jgi:hypothetical protein